VTGLLPFIDTVCVSEEIGVSKPDPRAFDALAEALSHAR
jgi:FMN phosphatase YigB (HAD superfamily)